MKEHATERRTREVGASFCIESGCEFEGQPAVQGHCFHRPDDVTERYLARKRAAVESEIAEMREQYPDADEFLRYLSAMYECVSVNWSITLDEVIKLRCENAELRRTRADVAPR